jgi:hypothetical protein
MKPTNRIIAGAAAGIVALVLWTPAVAGAHTTSPFDGSWESIDTDGSYQTLTVQGSAPASRSVRLVDEGAGVCGGSLAEFSGPGTIDGTDLHVSGTLRCRLGGNPLRTRIGVSWTYNSDNDTLVDEFGVVWHRPA